MKVLYVHQFFNTPQDGGSIRSYYLCNELVKNGYEVHVITSHVHKKKLRTIVDGIHLTYLPIQYDNSYKFWARSVAYLKFALLACLESSKIRKVDFCYIMTTPLTTGLIALYNKIILKRPYIFEVGDLWPLVPIEMGVIRNQLFSSLLFKFEKICYQYSRGSIGLSPPITTYIRKSSPETSVETVHNMSDCAFFKPAESTSALKKKYGIKNEFVIAYTGTFGLANDLGRMMDVISNLQHLPVQFLFIGMGAEKEKVEKKATALQLSNCQILSFQPKEGMKEILSISDAMFISFANYPSLFTGSPNKFFDALAAGLLVITNFDGWIKELIEKEQCGFSFTHDSASDFERKIQPFLTNKEQLEQYKLNGRQLAESRYSIKKQSAIQIEFLKKNFG